MTDNTSVKVALRIRPLVQNEISKGSKDVLQVIGDQVRILNTDKAFTYNHVFEGSTSQADFYNECIQKMIDNLFNGYNVTILAYGQTGSGKTHSMGTAYSGEGEMAVIPRAVHDIFHYVKDNFGYEFTLTVSFMELYQEVLYDLLSDKTRDQCIVDIREDTKGIFMPNLTEKPVTSAFETLQYLAKGSMKRAVGSTNMNSQSSRSHAIFTITICIQRKGDSNFNKTAKFHLVDLAGSERSKKTGATGQTFKEGININKGLLALGNVISALGDEKQQGFISYRDSNLTRLLKDSLGGNSITLMIACVSPADYNLEETLSTLRYADRARKIKNRPVVNEDPKAAEINKLNKLVQQLRLELIGQGGPIICQKELDDLKKDNAQLVGKVRDLTGKLSCTLFEKTALYERVLLVQTANENLQQRLLELREEYNITVNEFQDNLENYNVERIKENVAKLKTIQSRFSIIDAEQKKNQNELRDHEEVSIRNISTTDLSSEMEINERQESHTAEQIKLNMELQDVIKNLAMKEHLAEKIAANTCHLVDYGEKEQTEARLVTLEKERDALLQQLKANQTLEPSSKVSEQRRKRVQELEGQIQDLRKKVVEQARLIKLKEKDEQKIRQLNNEIVAMKQTKVKLIRNMRKETETFRNWKLQRERELTKLKDQGRKRENQIVKMQRMYDRQQNVLKRKFEEAAATNKRLKDALAVRKAAQINKISGKMEQLGQWISQELEVYVSTLEAKASLKNLLEDRAMLMGQLQEMKDSSQGSDEQLTIQMEEDIELRSMQINGLQQKLCDSEEDEKTKSRWDKIQSMSESKHVLETLFQLVGDKHKIERCSQNIISEQQARIADAENRAKEAENKIENMKAAQQQETANIQKEYEGKITVLLKQLRGLEVDNQEHHFAQQLNIVQEKLQSLEQELEESQAESEKLRQNKEELSRLLEEAKSVPEHMKTPHKIHLPKNEIPENDTPKTDIPKNDILEYDTPKIDIPKNCIPNSDTPKMTLVSVQELDVSTDFLDDNVNDPDWRNTPLAKRIRQMRVSKPAPMERLTTKRTSGGGCNCKGRCSTRTCGCKKFSKNCSSSCKCSTSMCMNKSQYNEFETPEAETTSSSSLLSVSDSTHYESARSNETSATKQDDQQDFELKRRKPLEETSNNVFVRPKDVKVRKLLPRRE